jgi:hypothetical protein
LDQGRAEIRARKKSELEFEHGRSAGPLEQVEAQNLVPWISGLSTCVVGSARVD